MATQKLFGGTLRIKSRENVRDIVAGLRSLAKREVLVGYPAENAGRNPVDGEQTEMTNAAIGYVQENGDPDLNIPARPHLGPGVAAVAGDVMEILERGLKSALSGRGPEAMEQAFHRVGQKAADSVRKTITDGLEPPLAEATLLARARRGSKGAKKELAARAEGRAASTEFAKPLIDSGQLRRAVNYVIRNKKDRS